MEPGHRRPRPPTPWRRPGAPIDAAGPGTVVALPGDVDDPVHVAALVGAAAGQGRFELVVNNAGTLGPSPLPPRGRRCGPATWPARWRTNVVAPLRVIQAAAAPPAGRPRRRSSTSPPTPRSRATRAGAATGRRKAALEQLSRVLAAEEPDVRVYWVDPGDMRTQMHQDAFPGEDISDRPAAREPGARPGAADRAAPAERPVPGRGRSAEALEAVR